MDQKKARMPALDGLRAIAVAIVIVCHYAVALSLDFNYKTNMFQFLIDGRNGVGIFFVISGFLIASLLFEEKQTRRTISLSAFYTRRFFKLVPPLLVYTFACFTLNTYVGNVCSKVDYWSSITFTKAIFMPINPELGCTELVHTWSLSVEEFFYFIIAPAIVYLSSNKLRLLLAIGFVISFLDAAFVRSAVSLELHKNFDLPVLFPVIKDLYEPFMGVLAAIYVYSLREHVKKLSAGKRVLFVLLLMIIVAFPAILFEGAKKPLILLKMLVPGVFTIFVIIESLCRPSALVSRVLSMRLLTWIGKRSYSIYLWQQFFILFSTHAETRLWFQAFPVSLILTILFGHLSYTFIELPSYNIGHKISDGLKSRRQMKESEDLVV